MQPFTIAAFTFGTKNSTVPEIGTYKIIGFSVANELSIGVTLINECSAGLGAHAPKKNKKYCQQKELFLHIISF